MRITTLVGVMAVMLAVIVTVAPRIEIADEANIAGLETSQASTVRLAAH